MTFTPRHVEQTIHHRFLVLPEIIQYNKHAKNKHTEAKTTWPPLCRRYSKCIFLLEKCLTLFQFHWNLFAKLSLAIYLSCFRQLFGAEQATSQYLNQLWCSLLVHKCVNEVSSMPLNSNVVGLNCPSSYAVDRLETLKCSLQECTFCLQILDLND